MTVNELIAKLNQMQVSGDAEIRVRATGGMRSGKSIINVSAGFDWDAGALILHPQQPLTLAPPPAELPTPEALAYDLVNIAPTDPKRNGVRILFDGQVAQDTSKRGHRHALDLVRQTVRRVARRRDEQHAAALAKATGDTHGK